MTGIMTYIHHLIIYLIASEMKHKNQTMVVDVGMIIIYICSSLGFQTANKEAYLKHPPGNFLYRILGAVHIFYSTGLALRPL